MAARRILTPSKDDLQSTAAPHDDSTLLTERRELFVTSCSDHVVDVRSAYFIVGCFSVVAATICVIVYIVSGPTLKRKSYGDVTTTIENEAEKKNSENSAEYLSKPRRYLMLSIMSIYCAFIIYFNFLPTHFVSPFVIQGLNWPVEYGPMMTSVFTGLAGAGRVLCIPLAYFMSPTVMISIMLVASTAAYALMCFISVLPGFMLWFSIGLAGIGSCALQTFSILWLGQHVPITAATGSLLLMSGSVGGISGSALVGRLMPVNHMFLAYICIIACVIDIVLFTLMQCIATRGKTTRKDSVYGQVPILEFNENSETETKKKTNLNESLKKDLDLFSSHSSLYK